MKILFICNEYPPYKHGGIGSFTRDIAEGLVAKGQQVTVWGLYNNVSITLLENINGVTVIRHPYTGIKSKFKQLHFIYILNQELKHYLKITKFDIIECQEWQGLLPLGLAHPGYVLRLHGAAIFFDKLLNRPGNRLMHLLEKFTINNAKNIVAVSNYCGRETLIMVGCKRAFTVIYNGVNQSKLNNFKKPYFIPYSIVFANSVLPKKGILELVAAFNIVQEKFPEASLTIIGKLGYQENGINIKELIQQKLLQQSLPKVEITGWLKNAEDVYHHLSTAHLCCYPSHMEGFGIAPVEAMAMAKPVLFMSNGPGPEVIEDGISGILCDCTDSKKIAEKIIMLFDKTLDSEKLGNNASLRVKNLFELNEVFIPNNIAYYKSILSIEN